jgi:hypothetical protein
VALPVERDVGEWGEGEGGDTGVGMLKIQLVLDMSRSMENTKKT